MNIHKLNKRLCKLINESEEKTFADWYGEDLTGQTYEGDINCSNQAITSLEGAPAEVNSDFLCYHNPNLKSLKGLGEVKGQIYSDIED